MTLARAVDWRPGRRDARLLSGSILFVYLAFHLVNHALGLISLAVAERGLQAAVAAWHSPPGTLLLYGAAATHVALAFNALFERRTLRMPPIELLRIVLGFGMPALLIGHAVSTRLAYEIDGHPTDYAHVVWTLWHSGRQGMQIALLVPGWLHGCLGLNFAFRKRAWFARLRFAMFGAALLLPVLAVLGFLSMSKEVAELASDPSWVAATTRAVDAHERPALIALGDELLTTYFAMIAAVLLARLVRSIVEARRGGLITITYPDRGVRVPRGWSVLEASRAHRIEHVSSCGGRGRCTTCRVRIVEGAAQCPPADGDELKALARIAAPPDTRLACQLRPRGSIRVVPLVSGPSSAAHGLLEQTSERELVVMLVASRWERSFYRLLPHDRLYAIHRLHDVADNAARRTSGVPSQRADDQRLFLFGLDEPLDRASHRAMRSSRAVASALDDMNVQLQGSIGCRASHSIYLHVGMTAIGDVEDSSASLSAAGDAIDAVRLADAADRKGQPDEGIGSMTSRVVASHAFMAIAGREMATGTTTHLRADGRDPSFRALKTGAIESR